ncbi:hypothetical protein C7T87_15050 [Xanthomonas hortorum pv. hederae]|nr:hypothetical protein C7T87_15050 [Xanthomonas hortorum pv. hederae]
MPRKSLHGRTCGVSRDGRRARALQQSRRLVAAHSWQLCSRLLNRLHGVPRLREGLAALRFGQVS